MRSASARGGGSVTKRHVAIVGVVATTLLTLGSSGTAGAWPGDLDGGFGSCGTRAVDAVAGKPSQLRAAAAAATGAVLAVGGSDDRGLVVRLVDGVPDAGFGAAGLRLVKFATPARFTAVAGAADGGAVAVGSRDVASAGDSVVARLTATGDLDTGFHSTGRVSIDVGGTDAATATALAADGSVFVGGNAGSGGYVLHYTAAGALDPSWSGDGKALGLPMMVRSIAIQPDGTVMVGGATTSSPADWRILRLDSSGAIDTGFGGATGRTVDLGGQDVATALARQADGKVVVTGYGVGAAHAGKTVVRRFLTDGTDDPAFTSFVSSFGTSDSPVSISAQSDGKLLVAANSSVGSDNDLVLARFDDDGTPDPNFGIDGATVSDMGRRSRLGGAVAPVGQRPVAVGWTRVAGRDVAAVVRYQDDASVAAPPVQGLTVDAFGGVHPWSVGCVGGPTGVSGNPYWPGWDIVRGAAALPGSRGMEVDAFGAVHGFTWGDGTGQTPVAHGTPYWPGWDIVRGIAVLPDGSGGYELDGFGGLHPFSIGSGAVPTVPAGAPYWSGFDIARGIALMPDGKGGYIVDGSGNLYRFGGAPAVNAGAPTWPGQDMVRGVVLAPDGSGGWLLDRQGGMHPFGTGGDPLPPAVTGAPSWPTALARGAAALPS